jgi:hypothetical protein
MDKNIFRDIKGITYVPNRDHKEGVGSIYQGILFAFLLSRYLKKKFIYYEPSFYKGHYKNIDEISTRWFIIFKFLNKYKSEECEHIESYNNIIKKNIFDKETIINIEFSDSYNILINLDRQILDKLINDLRVEFWSDLKDLNFFPRKKYILAIHLRDLNNGDVVIDKKSLPWQYFSYDYKLIDNNYDYYCKLYSSCINNILNTNLNDKFDIELHIHTNANAKTLGPLIKKIDKRIDVKLYINAPVDITFLDFLTADLLIAYHSSFSWIATLLRVEPSFLRNKFRHIYFKNTEIISEVLYTQSNLFKNILIFFKKYYYKIIFLIKY